MEDPRIERTEHNLPTTLSYWHRFRDEDFWAKSRRPASQEGSLIYILKGHTVIRAPLPRHPSKYPTLEKFHKYINVKRANIEAAYGHMVGSIERTGNARCTSCIQRKDPYKECITVPGLQHLMPASMDVPHATTGTKAIVAVSLSTCAEK